MALKKINENPKTTDIISIDVETPDTDDCFVSNPYKVNKVTIYYIQRDFLGTNWGEYKNVVYHDKLQEKFLAAQKELCNSPTQENKNNVEKLRREIESASQSTIWYFKDRHAVKVFGNSEFAAWDSTNTDDAILEQKTDEDGNPLIGRFILKWDPQGSAREGHYFACWTWTPNPSGEKVSAHIPFFLEGDPRAVTSIPIHVTPHDKYNTLLEKYLPEMYKTSLGNSDITPQVTHKLNQSVADGFTFMENLANQIIDLFDSNSLHESLLVYLSNLFNLQLKSNDPTLWRRQIKEAVPLFKKKGTLSSLEDAFSQSGMALNKFTQFWQLVSPYTWQESFVVEDSPTFELYQENIVLPIDKNNFGLWIKREGSQTYSEYSSDHVEFEIGNDLIVRMTWVGDELSVNPVDIFKGDTIKVLYQYNEIPGSTEQQHENYIRSLPLLDQRNEDDQSYPPKNWNVRLIDEDDALFDTLIPVRHSFHEPLVFGHIRTEFAYSENIYNMEEYNGSTRPSYDVCHIDKEFVDPCGACISSNYSVDVSIEELCNDRIAEAQDVLEEHTPFHANLHSINLTGKVNDFVLPPEETIEVLISFNFAESVLSGQANPFFNRVMEGGLTNWKIDRDDLTDKNTVLSGKMGNAHNNSINLVALDVSLGDLGIMRGNNILEVLSPSSNAGNYKLGEIDRNVAEIETSVSEPLDQSTFTFHISNIVHTSSSVSITQDNLFEFKDSEKSFHEFSIKTQWDVQHTAGYSGNPWEIAIPTYSSRYKIERIIGETLILEDDGTLPSTNTSNLNYTIYDENGDEVYTNNKGSLDVSDRGYINLNEQFLTDIENFIQIGDYVNYSGQEYRISLFDGKNFWIEDYSGGDVGGASISIRRRLVRNEVGLFGYKGLQLTTFSDHESEFGVVNGSNPPSVITDNSKFKENFMFKIGTQYFKILKWNKKEVVLGGREQSWGLSGTTVAYSIIHFPKKEVNVQLTTFDHLDRDGHDVVIKEEKSKLNQTTTIEALSNNGNGLEDNVSQEESISFTIETKDGSVEEGEL